MPSKNVRLRIELSQLKRAAEQGSTMAAGRARLLENWLDDEDSRTRKRADDRCKVLIGAYVASELKAGRSVDAADSAALLNGLRRWLVRQSERLAVLGDDGNGSDAFKRITAPTTD